MKNIDPESRLIQFIRKDRDWIGDDSIEVNGIILSSDSFIEGVHFTPSYFSYMDTGIKTLRAAISDIGASGGQPEFYLLNLGFNRNTEFQIIEELFEGFSAVEKEYGIRLLGGDTFRCPVMNIGITAGGKIIRRISRENAKPGDNIYLTGNLGGSFLGYYALKHNIDSPIKKYHLRPEIRCRESAQLIKKYTITSMIDISDGLLIDSHHIAEESSVKLTINSEKIPYPEGSRELTENLSFSLKETILKSGEEFELLFTSPDNIDENFVTLIGKVEQGQGITIDGKEREPEGYSHFTR